MDAGQDRADPGQRGGRTKWLQDRMDTGREKGRTEGSMEGMDRQDKTD